jgi:hypothetical protein
VKRDEGRGTKEAGEEEKDIRVSGEQKGGIRAPGDQDAGVDSVGYGHRFVWTRIDFDRVFEAELA